MRLKLTLFFILIMSLSYSVVTPQDVNPSDLAKELIIKQKPDSLQNNVDSLTQELAVTGEISIIDTTIIIPKLEFVELKLGDALKALVRAYQLSVFIDTSVTGTITLRLDNVSLNDVLLFIIREYDLAWEKVGDIIKIYKPESLSPPPTPIEMSIDDGLLTCNLKHIQLHRFVNELIDLSGINIIIESGTSGHLSGRLQKVPIKKALDILLSSNGFTLRTADGIYYIGSMAVAGAEGRRASRFSVGCENRLVTVNVSNAPLSEVLSAIADDCGASFFMRGKVEGTVSVSFTKMDLDRSLGSLLRNTQYTYKKDDEIYFIGPKNSEDMFVSELILLKHLVAIDVEPLIPAGLTKQVSLKVAVEHNGLVVTGPKTVIDEIKNFLETIDISPAMVLFDLLVVDYSATDLFKFNLYMDNSGLGVEHPGQTYYPFVDVSGTGKNLQDDLDYVASRLGIAKIGPLSDDFFARLQIMQEEGKAKIRSRPKISTLCGHTASINVGTTQYYLLETKIVHPSQQSDVSTQTSQRFETVEASMSIEVTPYVNETGELIVQIQPEFSTPAASFDPDIPPTINHRVLKSTVRLRNGETIILGGLVQSNETSVVKKFPILGSLPLIGPIFQSISKNTTQTELMIYITPHVYYGSEGWIDIEQILEKD